VKPQRGGAEGRGKAKKVTMGYMKELGISDKDFVEITREKFDKAVREECNPDLAWFSLNDACNLNCRYCFADAEFLDQDPRAHIQDFLSTDGVLNILDKMVDAGTKQVMFAGGEPTLRKDLPQIVHYASMFMGVAMNTNGYLLDEKLTYELADAGLTQVKVSVDGLIQNHDWNRGEGSYEKAIGAIRNCQNAGIPNIMLIMTLSAQNYDDLSGLLKMTMEMGVDFTLVEFLPIGKAAEHKDWCLSREQVRDFQRLLFNAQKEYGWQRVAFENRYIVSEDQFCKEVCADPTRPCGFVDYCVGCISGIYSYVVNAQGRVAAGDILTLECGDLNKESLNAIWKNASLFKMLRDRDNLEGKCGVCTYRYVCGGCRRRAYALTGNLMAGDPGCWVDPKACLIK
jgi:radical SAM protein with 4Fe4S-binding SPASM domain